MVHSVSIFALHWTILYFSTRKMLPVCILLVWTNTYIGSTNIYIASTNVYIGTISTSIYIGCTNKYICIVFILVPTYTYVSTTPQRRWSNSTISVGFDIQVILKLDNIKTLVLLGRVLQEWMLYARMRKEKQLYTSAEGQRALVLIAMEVITRYFYLRSIRKIMIYFFVMSYIGINSCSINYKVTFVMLSTSLYFLGKYCMHKW